MGLRELLQNLPEVKGPTEKKVSFNTGIKWTLIVLVLYFVLSNITLYGISETALSRFEYLAILLGTTFPLIRAPMPYSPPARWLCRMCRTW